MKTLVSAEQMKKIDRDAYTRYGIPTLLLMEHAGGSVIDEIERVYGTVKKKSILVVCGNGNNGGDGFVAARHALHRGAEVTVVFSHKPESLRGDAETNFTILVHQNHSRLKIVTSLTVLRREKKIFTFIIDAMFGTSFHGSLTGSDKAIVKWINAEKKSIRVAVDIPSGLNATTGEHSGVAVNADRTITMGLLKSGLIMGKGREQCGLVTVADIHFPAELLNSVKTKLTMIEESDVRLSLPKRPIAAHKHSVGKVFILAGSKGLTGAALLASSSAMRSGAGAVILGIPDSSFDTVAKRTVEVMPLSLPSTREGSLAFASFPMIKEKIQWADVVVIGPGLSRVPETQRLIREIVTHTSKKLVIDADGLNALTEDTDLFRQCRAKNIVITPHLGEFSRLTGEPAASLEKDRCGYARRFAVKNKVTIVLKGAPSIVTSPDGNISVNSSGNPGMATAGAGDVLSGCLAGFIGQGGDFLTAVKNSVYVHGKAGDFALQQKGEYGMIAGDICEALPDVINRIVHGDNENE